MASWIAWFTANATFTVLAVMSHSYLAASINGAAAGMNAAIILVSIRRKQADRPTGTTDWICLVSALLCLVMVIAFPENKPLSAFMAMAANAVATWPTLAHAWHRPREEAWQLFAANAAAGGLGFGAVAATSGMHLATIAGPMMATIGNVSLTLITAGRGWLTRAEETVEAEIRAVEDLLEENLSATEQSID
ncbi:MAG: hypothetical protein ACQR33_00145 [Candidatus Saccharibacteria bacterium]